MFQADQGPRGPLGLLGWVWRWVGPRRSPPAHHYLLSYSHARHLRHSTSSFLTITSCLISTLTASPYPVSSSIFSALTLRPSDTFLRSAALHNPWIPSSHPPHFCPTGRHIDWPRPTRRWLISRQRSWGSHDCSACRVSSGFLVLFHPHKFVMRWTCTSTPMPSVRSHADDMHR